MIEKKQERSAAGKKTIFKQIKHGDKIYVTVVPGSSKETPMPITQGRILEKSIIYTNCRKNEDKLVLNYYNYYRMFRSEKEFARDKSYLN